LSVLEPFQSPIAHQTSTVPTSYPTESVAPLMTQSPWAPPPSPKYMPSQWVPRSPPSPPASINHLTIPMPSAPPQSPRIMSSPRAPPPSPLTFHRPLSRWNDPRSKTKDCRTWRNGRCIYGSKCKFRHPNEPYRPIPSQETVQAAIQAFCKRPQKQL
jgi:hypothetical protein